MKILWVTNTIFPDLALDLGIGQPSFGGWMYGLLKDISAKGASLVVVTVSNQFGNHLYSNDGIEYRILNSKKPNTVYDISLEKSWRDLMKEVNPDLVHIHGTEYAHGLALMKSCPNHNYLVSIQGLVGVIARYYTAGIPIADIIKNITIRDILRRDTILDAKRKFKKRGETIENEYIKRANHISGRTQWDYDHVKTINPTCIYHFCNRSMRDAFYGSQKWSINSKHEHTIFLSQAGYPIKGLHKVIEALNIIKNEFPNIRLRIGGEDITKSGESFKDKFRLGGYGKYIKRLITTFKLSKNIQFVGFLNAEEMVKEYLCCHLFICPSSIDNSPNSLGEAQLLGVPSIGSYVGGIPDMIVNGETGLLYRFEETEMLAQAIKKIFNSNTLAEYLSLNSIKMAAERNNRETIAERTLDIYSSILAK